MRGEIEVGEDKNMSNEGRRGKKQGGRGSMMLQKCPVKL